ncbi:NPIPA8 isoform 3 [Pan troglodytes]|uniref:NPIPA8 isoform 3 n=1 Tax=Pan troglodytes TaxID=9598 RepID=A0A2J8Q5E1_PANTR|nr:NPIPA8 isoform 3 [Pan troglodytes]
MLCCLRYERLSGGCKPGTLLGYEVLPAILPSFVFYVLSPKVTLRNPGSSGRKERPEAGTGSWLGRTRNQSWLRIITVFLRSYKFAISLRTSYLSVSFLKTIFPSQNGHDGSTDVQQRARRSNRRRQEAKIHKMKVTTKVNRHDKINGKRKTAKEHLRKLSIKEREHAEKERQLSEAEENGKLDMKEIHTYKEMFQHAQVLRRRAEDYYKCKIPPSARKPLCNWVRMAAAEHPPEPQDTSQVSAPSPSPQLHPQWMIISTHSSVCSSPPQSTSVDDNLNTPPSVCSIPSTLSG